MIDTAGQRPLQDSCERQKHSFEESRNAFGEHHPDTLTAMLDLADCLWAQGRLIAARKLEEAVVEGRRRALGKQHADTLKAIGKLAVTLGAQGNLEDARRLQEEVVSGRHPHPTLPHQGGGPLFAAWIPFLRPFGTTGKWPRQLTDRTLN